MSKPTSSTSKIFWTSSEYDRIADCILELIDNGTLDEKRVEKTLPHAVLMAQNTCLWVSRIRSDASVYQSMKPSGDGEKRMRLALHNARARRAAKLAANPPPKAPAAAPSSPATAPASAAATPTPAPTPESAPAPAVPLAAALQTLTEWFEQTVRRVVREELAAAMPAPTPAPVHTFVRIPQPSTPTRKPRVPVDVVGLLGAQAEVVKGAKVADEFDLRFIASGQLNVPLRENVVLTTKFINHSIQAKAGRAKANVMYANGGAASVIVQLEELRSSLARSMS